jgi:hypothetical protein
MITLKSSEEYNFLKCAKVIVLFEQCKVTEFFTACSIDQCRRCQKFGHHHTTCIADNGPTCAICTATHRTEYHQCTKYPTVKGYKCIYTKYKYVNYTAMGHADTQHAAYNTRCPIKLHAVQEAWQKTQLEAVSLEHIPTETNLIADTTMTTDE